MKLALAQMRCYPGEVARNGQLLVRHAHAAADAGCDAVVFPEMSDTGYHMPTIVRSASSWDGGLYAELANVAASRKILVIAGLSERVGDDIFNSIAVIGTDGRLVAKYRKTHLITAEPVCEQNFIRPGDALTLCEIGSFQVGLLTCYDVRFPELARRLVLRGAELLIIPAAFPQVRINHWDILTMARAIENQAYVAAVNRVGDDCGLVFGGTSRLLDPAGVLLARANETEETLLIGEVQRERLTQVRDGLKVFRDRREELYG